ncbi:MAG: DNA-binding protein WhiA [Lachnospiraceae bacterium]|nr:DNA-binding protein WhiA [Lachnospiraceae bacterium]MBQ8261274.1 DNA-binding protein WhiA [Lachnospiraceae bacterium]MBQ8263084.1 DNA-binding protein WhiA [Lachnospiraceae bacterium]
MGEQKVSFSLQVKEEIEKHMSQSRHCQLAEMASYVINIGERRPEGGFLFRTENETVIRKVFTLLKKTYNIYSVAGETESMRVARDKAFCIVLEAEQADKVLQSVKYEEVKERQASGLLIKNACCKRAFLRGTFQCIGSMSDPDKSYHLEFLASSVVQAQQIQGILADFSIDAKITPRKKYFVVYIKEGEAIVDLLNIMGAHVALMNLENTRIVKEVRGSVNRRVNCETANIAKTINASTRQIEDILYLRDHYGFHRLPDNLREMAEVRLENPDAPLKDLGGLLDPPVGKSGVNHRLRKLSELAEKIREN